MKSINEIILKVETAIETWLKIYTCAKKKGKIIDDNNLKKEIMFVLFPSFLNYKEFKELSKENKDNLEKNKLIRY